MKCNYDLYEASPNIYGHNCYNSSFDKFINLVDLFWKHHQESIKNKVRYLRAFTWAAKGFEVL